MSIKQNAYSDGLPEFRNGYVYANLKERGGLSGTVGLSRCNGSQLLSAGRIRVWSGSHDFHS